MHVFVLSINGKPLMPTTQAKARKLLHNKKAVIHGYRPFTIQLTYRTETEIVQAITIGVDTGARFIGLAVETQGKIIAKGEIELRTNVSKLLTLRKLLRRARRSRKLRYRELRFNNRARPDGWLPPSIQSRVDNTIIWIEKFKNLLPNPNIIIELSKFDVQKMEGEDIYGIEYQHGGTYDFYNKRYYIFARDEYKCRICNGKSKDKILQTHHIIQKVDGGSDSVRNLVTICSKCHKGYHKGRIKHKFKKPKQYKETAFMNILRNRIIDRFNCKITYGYITTVNRKLLGLSKSHINDAITITGVKNITENNSNGFIVRQFRKKKRSLHEMNSRKRKGGNIYQCRNERNRKYCNGFYRGDVVLVDNKYGHINGLSKTGYANIKDINNNSIYLSNMKCDKINIKNLDFISHNNNWLFSLV